MGEIMMATLSRNMPTYPRPQYGPAVAYRLVWFALAQISRPDTDRPRRWRASQWQARHPLLVLEVEQWIPLWGWPLETW